MRARFLVLGLLLSSAAGLSACGTMVDGGTQTVDVVVKGSPTASCNFTTSKFRNFGHFPNKMVIERSKENLQADCQGEQNRYVKFEVAPALTASGTAGNVATGILPGMAYDAATGSMWEYPNPIIVDFRTVGEGPKPQWPDNVADSQVDPTRIGTAEIAAPAPVRMQPIMDEDLNPALPQRFTATPVTPAKTQIIDAARIAVDAQPASGPIEMKPIISPEDHMGIDPGKVKAEEEAKRKAKDAAAAKAAADKKAAEEAAKRAAEEAAAAKRAADDAAEAAAAAAQVETLPETTDNTAPAEPVAEPAAEPVAEPAAAEPAPAATTAEEAPPSEATSQTVPLGPTQLTDSPTALPTVEEGGEIEPAEPGQAEPGQTEPGQEQPPQDDMDQYLQSE